MRLLQPRLSAFCALLLITAVASAQNDIRIEPAHGRLGWLLNPYRPRDVPPINLSNSSRLESWCAAAICISRRRMWWRWRSKTTSTSRCSATDRCWREKCCAAPKAAARCAASAWASRPGRRASACKGVSLNIAGAAATPAETASAPAAESSPSSGPRIPSLDPTVLVCREFPARHLSAEQHRSHRNHRADSGHAHL